MSVSEDFSERPVDYVVKREIEFSRAEPGLKFQNEFNFDPPVSVQVAKPAERVQLKIKYFNTILGILRLLIIIVLFCGWLSVACVPKVVNGRILISPVLAPTRDAYLFFGLVGWFLSIAILLLNVLNIVNLNQLGKVPWMPLVSILKYMLTDAIWSVSMFVLGVVCAIREANIRESILLNADTASFYNVGAFASAAFFAFLATIVYLIDFSYIFLNEGYDVNFRPACRV